VLDAIHACPLVGVRSSSASINATKKSITVYFDNKALWRLAMNVPFILAPSVDNKDPLTLHLLTTLSDTNNKAWTRLFIAKMLYPIDVFMVRRFLEKRIRVKPEVVALYHKPTSHLCCNFGFILTRNVEIVQRLLEASIEARSLTKNNKEYCVLIQVADRRRRRNG